MVTGALFRIVFFGTPQFAIPSFDALQHSGHQVVGAVTRADRPRGRGLKVSDSPIKARALTRHLRDHGTLRRRPFVRYFACAEDLSHDPETTPLPQAVVDGKEAFLVIGAIAGG